MYKVKKGIMVLALATSTLLLSGCSVGTSSLFMHPEEQGYEYGVTYDTLGGHINQEKKRVVYYADNSLLFEPSGTSGMLVQPKNGDKSLVGWYTKYTTEETQNGTVYNFNEEDLWDFSADRISDESTVDKSLSLYARWADNPSINFLDAANPDESPLLKWTINVGSELKRPTSTEPKKQGYTLIDYYKDPECTEKYEFNQLIEEDDIDYSNGGKAQINIYCKFVEGDLKRVKTVSDLKAMADNKEGHYILANDMDLSKEVWTPIEGFSGVFDGNGYAIENLNLNVKNRVSGIAAKKAEEVSYGLFSKLEGAKIMNLTMKDANIVIDKSTNVKLCVGALAGRTKRTTIENCVFDGITISSDGALNIDIVASGFVAGDYSTTITNSIFNNINVKVTTSGNLETIEGK